MPLREALSNPDTLILGVGPGGQPGEVLQLRVRMQDAPELAQLARAEGVYEGFAIQESAEVQQVAALIASFGAGLGGVAAVIRAFAARHQHRSVTFVHEGTTYELKGMPQKDMEALIQHAVEASAEAQRENLKRLNYRFPNEQ